MNFPNPLNIHCVRAALTEAPLNIADVGAAEGIDPLMSRYRAPGLIQFFGFEPNPSEFEKFRAEEDIRYFRYAISDSVRDAEFRVGKTLSSLERRADVESTSGEKFHSITVKVETLSHLSETAVIPPPDVIKTDTEGHDFAVLQGAGSLLDNVLAVKTEFAFHHSRGGSCFADIDQLLRKHGLILFGMQYNDGTLGEFGGGDALYLRSIASVLKSGAVAEQRTRSIKLIVLCHIIRNLDYAFIIANEANRAGLFSDSEAEDINSRLSQLIYLPTGFASGSIARGLAHFLFMGVQVLSGKSFRDKSLPKGNRLDRYRYLFVDSRWFGKRPKSRLDRIYRRYKEQSDVYEK